jgi:hypothetical protein
MEIATYIITALAASGLLGLGGYLCWRNDSAAVATAALGFVFLLTLLLHMAKFKRVKGFGFEGETWDQEQVKAAELRKSLSEISLSLSQQAALLAAKVGYWDSALSLNELAGVLKQIGKSLDAIGISNDKKLEILTPIYRRVEQYYWTQASGLVRKAFAEQRQIVQAELRALPAGEAGGLQAKQGKVDALGGAIERANSFTLHKFRETPRLTFLIDTLAQNAAFLDDPAAAIRGLNGIDEDLRFFLENRNLRES